VAIGKRRSGILAKQLIPNKLYLIPIETKAVVKGARLEHSKVFTVEITLGQCPVPFWYRQTRVDGNIARTGRGFYSFLKSKLCLRSEICRNSFHRNEGVEALVFLYR
jgi:hypothetical protein